MIAVRSLGVSLAGRPILGDIAFAARPGEVTVIVGPNGSGKSTLLKALCADHPYRGEVRLNGEDLRRLGPVRAASLRAVLPQASTLPFPFTVREVVSLGLSAGRPGVAEARLRRLPEDALARVDLDGFGGRFYGELSGGEQQRVQLARVLCQVWEPVLDGVPRWLWLDEPVSSLDIKHQLGIMEVARRFAQAGGGVLAVLHDLNLAAVYADAILVIHAGRLAGFGPPEAVLTDALIERVFDCALHVGRVPDPATPFVLPQSADGFATRLTTSKVA